MPQPSQSCRRHRYGKAFYRQSNSLWPERLSEYYPTQVGEMVGGRNRRNARDRHDAGRQPGRWPNGGGRAQYFPTERRGSRRDGGLHQIAAATLIHLGIDLPGFGRSEGRADLMAPEAMGGFVVKV